MKKLALFCIAALGAALLVIGTAPVASAYPELTCSVSVDRQVVSPGERFTATGFPRVFYLRYHGYRKFFPLWALARYRNLKRAGTTHVTVGM